MSTPYADDATYQSLGLPASVLTRAGELGIDRTRHYVAASRWLDGIIGPRFATPLVAWDDDVREAVCARAGWTMLAVVGFNPKSGDDQVVRERYLDAQRWAEDVRDGRLAPTLTPAVGVDTAPLVLSDCPRGQ
jgi:hypothetical protein